MKDADAQQSLGKILERERDARLAYLFLRVLLGLNITIHGVSRILAGPTGFAHNLVPLFSKTPLPGWTVYGFGLVLPFAEAVCGALLLIGLRTREALMAGAMLIVTLTFGSTLRQDWDSASIQLTYGLIYALLLAFVRLNRFSVDGLLMGQNRPE